MIFGSFKLQINILDLSHIHTGKTNGCTQLNPVNKIKDKINSVTRTPSFKSADG